MSKPEMRVMYDFEFLERAGHVDPISAGFVREDGRELYLVFTDFDTRKVAKHKWLMENVMSSIGHSVVTDYTVGTGQPVADLEITDPAACTKAEGAQKILEFVSDITPEWWAWYGAYDHVALCSLYGAMIDLPQGWPMFTMDLKQLHKQLGYVSMPRQPEGLHNALEDARFNVVRYEYLKKLAGFDDE